MGNCVSKSAPVLLAFVTACASTAPLDELRESRAALARAIEAGAEDSAPREVALAREKIELGERWIAASDYKPARWLVEQARVDAELAAVKAAAALVRQAR